MGAFSTGTHGGDVKAGPIADAVIALHLIDGKGQHHWIERTQIRPNTIPIQLTDPDKVRATYPSIEHHVSNDLMDAAVIACGRLGAIYSVVLRAVRQFALREERSSEHDWHHWRSNLIASPIFGNHFAQIVINPYGTFWSPDEHTCYLTTRTLEPLAIAGNPPLGRQERGVNPGTGKPFGKRMTFSSRVCASDQWLRDELDHQIGNLERALAALFITEAVLLGLVLSSIPAVKKWALDELAIVHTNIAINTALIFVLGQLVGLIAPLGKFGDTMAAIMNFCVDFQDPLLGLNPLMPFMRAIIGASFDSDQEADPDDPHTPAISYAAMDGHDYTNVGCNSPGDSVEVFFEVGQPLIDFIDRILDRVDDLYEGEITGEPGGFGGYICLRFMTRSPAPLAMQKWPLTCSIEVAGLSTVDGSDAYIAQVHKDALEFGGIIHWGQKNECTQSDVEAAFGTPPGTPLHAWREALSQLSDHGAQALFSTPFSRQRGLEITEPRIYSLACPLQNAPVGEISQVSWNAVNNPPGTTAVLQVAADEGTVRHPVGLEGPFPLAFAKGRFSVRLELDRELNGNHYGASRAIELRASIAATNGCSASTPSGSCSRAANAGSWT